MVAMVMTMMMLTTMTMMMTIVMMMTAAVPSQCIFPCLLGWPDEFSR